MLPWAIAKQQATEWNIDDTGQVCKPTGPFRQGHAGGGGFRFVDAGSGMLYQVGGSIDQRGVQRIRLNGPRSRTPRPTWNGESVGRFEGTDTLVIDTIGYNDKSWLNSDRWPHTEELRVIERYRLYGGGAYMQLRVFIDDRHALKEPYTYTRYYRKVAEPTEGGESVCNQNPPEDDLWADRRNKLLDEFDARADGADGEVRERTAAAGHRCECGSGRRDRRLNVGAACGRAPAQSCRRVRTRTRRVGRTRRAQGVRRTLRGRAAAARLRRRQRAAISRSIPAKHCMVVGPFRMMARDDARFELLPTAGRVTMLFEITALGNKRELYLGRTGHSAKLAATYQGDSIARWEGDTLVVDTVGFNEFTWLNDAGAPHSDALRLVERFRLLPGGQVLEYQVTAEDPQALAKPYTYTRYFQRSGNPTPGRLLRKPVTGSPAPVVARRLRTSGDLGSRQWR